MLARREASPRAEVVEDANILGGMPCVSGTRIPAATVLAYLRDGCADRVIREDYPTLPIDGIEAVVRRANEHGLELGRRAEAARFPQDLRVDALLIDECLSIRLVAVAQDRGLDATHVTSCGLNGTPDWRLMPTIRNENLILVTNNRGDSLKLYAAEAIHNGLIVIVPSVSRDAQVVLFEAAIAAVEQMSDLVNVVVEVFEDGRVEIKHGGADDLDAH